MPLRLTRRPGLPPKLPPPASARDRRGYLLFGREVKEVDEVGVSEDAELLEAPSHALLPRDGVAGFTPQAVGVAGLPPHALADALGSEADGVRGRVTCHGTEDLPLALSPLVSH